MPQGIEVYNANGTLQFGIGDRAYRVLTVADIGNVNSGSVTVTTTEGTVVVTPIVADTKYAPAVSIGSGTVTWNYGSIPSGNRDAAAKLQIGCY